MPPSVASLISLDVHRDGGSLSASFLDAADAEYTLLLPVNIVERRTGETAKLGFKAPVLQEYVRTPRTSPITGKTDTDVTVREVSLSWTEARTLLNAIECKVSGFRSEYLWVFPEMVEAAKAEGRLAPQLLP